MTRRFVFYGLLLSVLVATATAQSTIFIVRHGEKADSSNDSDLSEAGRARAEALAKMLKDKNITAVYATEFKRTQQTAAPLAKALGLTVITVQSKDKDALVAKLRASDGNALVVGHGNTIPDLVKALGISEPINIGENDYDNLFEIVLGEKPRLIHLHYH
jgi:2,3-bisphosphoglycerate-dependent phosphoglycerate mutase